MLGRRRITLSVATRRVGVREGVAMTAALGCNGILARCRSGAENVSTVVLERPSSVVMAGDERRRRKRGESARNRDE